MISCMINGLTAYPSNSSDVKITLSNPFVQDGDEKTMEVVFPMGIPANREVFGNLNRIDTNFQMDNFDECRLMADGIEIICGVGTITSVTSDAVKMQILSGKSYLRFRASFDSVFIDGISYGSLEARHEHLKGKPQASASVFDLSSEINGQGFVGEPGRYAFLPVHDETNDWHVNMPVYLYGDDNSRKGVNINFRAINPNLIYVLETVLAELGYSVKENYFNRDPWNKLYVASAKMTTVMSKALPHWSAYKFLDEIRKLFNACFLFDEQNACVSIVPFGESGGAGIEYIEPVGEFSTSFDEEGLQYLGSSNLEYALSDCERDCDCVSQDTRKAFTFRECSDVNVMYEVFQAMSVREKMTTLFHCPVGFFYGVPQTENGVIVSYLMKECGWLSPLVRTEGGSTETLHIVPAAMKWQDAVCYELRLTNRWGPVEGKWSMMGGQMWKYHSIEANVSCDYPVNASVEWLSFEEQEPANSLDYVTLQDVIENDETIPASESDDSPIEVFFAAGSCYYTNQVEKYGIDRETGPGIDSVRQPIAYTDCRHVAYHASVPRASMGLNPVDGVTSIGLLHNSGIRIRRNVNGNNEVCIRFLFDGKPDPRKVFYVKNRKFICSRIEMTVTGKGISPLKTGFFYEKLD